MKRILPKTMSALALAMVSTPGVWAQTAPPKLGEAANAELDSIQSSLDKYESMARRSLLGGGSKPVSFAGEAIGKIVSSAYADYPAWMAADATQFKNSFATLRMGMVAAPNRNLRLWSKIAFNNAMLGGQEASDKMGDGSGEVNLPAGYRRSTSTGEAGFRTGNLVYEDMCAGLVAKIGPTVWSAKLGGVLWNELSPLTVWKIQPRIFAWDYLPFELEQSTAQFYDYGTVKGEKSGRAAWNKKPFQGMQLESVELPWGLYLNSYFGFYEGYGKNQPWLIPQDKNTELQYTGTSTGTSRSYATKGIGIGDGYRWSSFLRVAKTDLPGGLAGGLNWFSYQIDENYPKQWGWEDASDQPQSLLFAPSSATTWVGRNNDKKNPILWTDSLATLRARFATAATKADSTTLTTQINAAVRNAAGKTYVNNYYVSPQVGSFDLRRNVPGGVNFHIDVAMSKADSVFYKVDSLRSSDTDQVAFKNANGRYRSEMQAKAGDVGMYQEIGRTNTGWVPGVYADVNYPMAYADVQLRSVYLPKKFQSPASVANPIDGIFPYEANMTGAGKFAGSDNGTAYASNMVGSNLIVKVPVPRGHAKISWGLHSQLEEGSDMVYFPWRQNGAAYNMTLGSNFTQYDQGLLDDYLRAANGGSTKLRQARRFGDEFYFSKGNINAPSLGQAGGQRGAFMSIYEGFAAYKIGVSWKGPKSRTVVINAAKGTSDSSARVSTWIADSTAFYNDAGVQEVMNDFTNGVLPSSKKFTQNISLDGSYEISRLWEGKRSLFLSGYAAFNSVTRDNRVGIPAFSADDDNVLLMGRNLRFEPVFQVTPKFYVVGLIGNEVWKSNYGVASIVDTTGSSPTSDAGWKNLANLVNAPIDYSDWIYGAGFDWDMASRVGLHVRCQYFTHEDKGISKDVSLAKGINDYQAWLTTAEVKMWF